MRNVYSYQSMKKDLRKFSKAYPKFLKVFCLAGTAAGNKIYGIRLGNPKAEKRVIIQASMHAREWFNTELVMRMVGKSCRQWKKNASYRGISYSRLFESVCFFIIPMVNPDGVLISQYGSSGIHDKELQKLISKMATGKYKYWKANARGVDLNRNYSTGFARGTLFYAGAQEYAGKSPFSERETRALVKLIHIVKPKMVINYHSAGHLIYYREAGKLVRLVRRLTGYKLCQELEPANGNLGDWLSELGIEWCTLETCVGKAPAGRWQLLTEWRKHHYLIEEVALLTFKKSKL